MTASEAQAAARNAAARTHAGEHRKLVRKIGDLIQSSLAYVSPDTPRSQRSFRAEGAGWTISYHLADGRPGSEVLQVSLYIGERHKERFQ